MRKLMWWAAACAVLSGCADDERFALYRSSPIDPDARIPMANFDTDEPGDYNLSNCNRAAVLFQAQPGVTAKFWCERGRISK